MISRFFKRKPKAEKPKKAAPEKPKPAAAREKKPSPPRERPSPPKKLLTAEGWKRLMMRKTSKVKK